jgi:hypothetical protein
MPRPNDDAAERLACLLECLKHFRARLDLSDAEFIGACRTLGRLAADGDALLAAADRAATLGPATAVEDCWEDLMAAGGR